MPRVFGADVAQYLKLSKEGANMRKYNLFPLMPLLIVSNSWAVDFNAPPDPGNTQGYQSSQQPEVGDNKLISSDAKRQESQYKNTKRQMIPVDPDQLRDFMNLYQDMEQAAVDKVPALKSRLVSVPLDPTARSATVRISPGLMTSMTVIDITGAPWPITTLGAGDPKRFKAENPDDYKLGNLVQVSPLQRAGRTNIQFTLQGQSLPISILVIMDDKVTDDRVVLRIKGRGPNAKEPLVGEEVRPVAESEITRVLDGLRPTDHAVLVPAQNLTIWLSGKDLYVRSVPDEALYSPYISVQRGLNGYRAYRLPVQDSLLLSRDGEIITVDLDIAQARLSAARGLGYGE